jgi:hypothetical protein
MTGSLFVARAFIASFSDGKVLYKLVDDNFISNDLQVYNDSIYFLGTRLSVIDKKLEDHRLIEQPCYTSRQGHILFRENTMFLTGASTVSHGDNNSTTDLTICSYNANTYNLIEENTVEGETTMENDEKPSVFRNLEEDVNGDLIIGGTSNPQPGLGPFATVPTSLLLSKFNSDIELICQNEFSFDRAAFMYSVTAGASGKNYIGASLYNHETNTGIPLLIQVDDNCLLSTTDEIIQDQNAIKIYPNPASDIIYIENKNQLDINKISLYQIDGELVKQYDGDISSIDVEGLATGIYTIKIHSEQGVYVQRVVITK